MLIYRLYWVREDKQTSLEQGDYATRDAAEAAIPERLAEMLSEGDAGDAEWIEAGD